MGFMAEYKDREHYIPLRRSDLVEMLLNDQGVAHDRPMTAAERETFRQFCRLVTATYHFEYHQKLEELKDEYAPFDPDSVTVTLKPLTPEEKEKRLEALFKQFTWLMERANYKRLGQEEIDAALKEYTPWGINMEVDFNVFERYELFARGDIKGKRYLRRWRNLWRREEITVNIFQRLVLILKLRPHKRLPRDINTAGVYLKVFRDIPKVDMEMLLPGARVQMPGATRLKLSGSLLGGLGYIVYQMFADLVRLFQHGIQMIFSGTMVGLGAMWAPVAALLGYGYKQWYGYSTTKQAYSLQLAQSLYFQNLDNNAGVLNHLLDEAEEQECREAILAYYYLWRYAGTEGWTSANLDDYIEMDLERLAKIKVDFEIEDAIAKLEKLHIIEKVGDRYRAHPLDKALEMLDWTWDNYFKYNNPEPEKPPIP
jgi:hypothetical protein